MSHQRGVYPSTIRKIQEGRPISEATKRKVGISLEEGTRASREYIPNPLSPTSIMPLHRAAWSILECARRMSTFLSCAFREQEDDQAALSLSHFRHFPEILREGFHSA